MLVNPSLKSPEPADLSKKRNEICCICQLKPLVPKKPRLATKHRWTRKRIEKQLASHQNHSRGHDQTTFHILPAMYLQNLSRKQYCCPPENIQLYDLINLILANSGPQYSVIPL